MLTLRRYEIEHTHSHRLDVHSPRCSEPAQDLIEMEGMTAELAYKLANHGILTREDLAEQSIDDLSDIQGLDEELAAKLIMTARAPWFAE